MYTCILTHTQTHTQTQQTPTTCDEAGFGDIAKLIGQKWSEMTPAAKQARVHIMLQEYMYENVSCCMKPPPLCSTHDVAKVHMMVQD